MPLGYMSLKFQDVMLSMTRYKKKKLHPLPTSLFWLWNAILLLMLIKSYSDLKYTKFRIN
jgi:hypothetical protein